VKEISHTKGRARWGRQRKGWEERKQKQETKTRRENKNKDKRKVKRGGRKEKLVAYAPCGNEQGDWEHRWARGDESVKGE